ncbi:phage GP46 family protein [Ephemeroptericola cinctiostellae]|nr:phage GP46 family protein [Ephemeroptericola cinctiostellae]
MAKVSIDLTEPPSLELFADPMVAAIVLSLFCDRRATDEFGRVGGGWWGDALTSDVGDRWGCERWTQNRRINTAETLRLEEDYDRAALQWLIDDGVVQRIEVRAFDAGNECMGLVIVLDGEIFELELNHGV